VRIFGWLRLINWPASLAKVGFKEGKLAAVELRVNRMPRVKSVKATLETIIEEDKIYILTAVNKHGQQFTISIHANMSDAMEAQKEFVGTRAGPSSYWKQRDGKPETFIETKVVKENKI
jgi:hypothetical protein